MSAVKARKVLVETDGEEAETLDEDELEKLEEGLALEIIE